MIRKRVFIGWLVSAVLLGIGFYPLLIQPAKAETSKRVMALSELKHSDTRLMPDLLGGRTIVGGGLYIFKPGETAHPEPKHSHDTDEVFIFVQGRGVLPIDGVEHPVKTGDVVIVRGGEDHHTRSSVEDPLVAAWYLVEKEEPAQGK